MMENRHTLPQARLPDGGKRNVCGREWRLRQKLLPANLKSSSSLPPFPSPNGPVVPKAVPPMNSPNMTQGSLLATQAGNEILSLLEKKSSWMWSWQTGEPRKDLSQPVSHFSLWDSLSNTFEGQRCRTTLAERANHLLGDPPCHFLLGWMLTRKNYY